MTRKITAGALLLLAATLGGTLGHLASRYARTELGYGSWADLSSLDAPSLGLGRSAVWTGSEMIVWGGTGLAGTDAPDTSSDGDPAPAGARYDPTRDVWSGITAVAAPAPRLRYVTLWADARRHDEAGVIPGPDPEMIVWGGIDASTGEILGDGGRYHPGADVWRPIATDDAPSARWDHTAVWTGQELIVWGGVDRDGGVLADGGRFDPWDGANGRWRPITAVAAPTARWQHSAVWTGSEMIIWGGADDTGDLADGARYDPVTDSWHPVSGAAVPAARSRHTAIWTGTEMIVWGGGLAEPTPHGSGGRYDPVQDAWAPTAVDGAPGSRAEHAAIWTGTEMIIWGGFSDGQLDDGGLYDPVRDRWSAVSVSGAPVTADGCVAVWTGHEMLVYGESMGWTLTKDDEPPIMGGVPSGGRYVP